MSRGPKIESLEGRFTVELRRDAGHQGEAQWQCAKRDPNGKVCQIYIPDERDRLQPEHPRQIFRFVASDMVGRYEDQKSGWVTEYWKAHLQTNITDQPKDGGGDASQERELTFNLVDRDDGKGQQWQSWFADEGRKLKFCCVPNAKGELQPAKDGDKFLVTWSFDLGFPFAEKGNTGFKVQRVVVNLLKQVDNPETGARNLGRLLSNANATNGVAPDAGSGIVPGAPPIQAPASTAMPPEVMNEITAARPATRRRRKDESTAS